MSHPPFLLKVLAIILTLNFNAIAWAHHCHPGASEQGMQGLPLSDTSVYQLRGKWTAQDGKITALSSLRGQPVIVAMVYTSCTSACPMITAEMQRIEHKLSPRLQAKVHFVLFSLDSERDTPQRLLEFAKVHGLDLDHWTLFNGSPNSVQELAATLGIRYKQDPGGNFQHSNAITLLDTEGSVSLQLEGLGHDPKDLLQKVEELQ
jgi:protein SCO1/2